VTTVTGEIVQAETEIKKMSNASSIDEFAETWKSFLNRLERIWSKNKARYRENPKWSGFTAHYTSARKTDPLLSYLRNARNADTHSEFEITDKTPSGIGIGANDGRTLVIDHLVINHQGKITVLKGSENMSIHFVPEKLHLKNVVNEMINYPVPTQHLGSPIDSSDLIEIACTGLN
jgi:hypothetical protein